MHSDDENDASWNIMTYTRGPSCVPGLTGSDVLAGSAGRGERGHGLYERNADDKRRLLDPSLHERVAFWLRPRAFSLKEIKMECMGRGVPVTGNKKVLALRLAFENLPADVVESSSLGYVVAKSSPNKWGGKRTKVGKKSDDDDDEVATTSKKKRSNPNTVKEVERANNTEQKAAKQRKLSSSKKDKVVVQKIDDTKCKECGVDGYVCRCEGTNCNTASLCCDCTEGKYKKKGVVSYCGECDRAFCHKCRLRFGGGCTSCQMMAE